MAHTHIMKSIEFGKGLPRIASCQRRQDEAEMFILAAILGSKVGCTELAIFDQASQFSALYVAGLDFQELAARTEASR